MKITISDTRSFVQDLKLAFAATGKNTRPILQNVKLTVSDGGDCLLQATDLSMGIRIPHFSIVGGEPGECLLPKDVLPILESSLESRHNSVWTLESKETKSGHTITLTGRNGERFQFSTPNPDDFPDVDCLWGEYVDVTSEEMLTLINRTVFAIDKDNTKYALSGVYLELDGTSFDAVATDGRRLGWQHITCDNAPKEPHSFGKDQHTIVPVSALKLLAKLCKRKPIIGGTAERALIAMQRTHDSMIFERDDVTLFTRCLDGRFPQWRGIIPQENRVFATVTAGALLTALNKVAPLVKNTYDAGVIMNCDPTGIVIEAKNGERQSQAACTATCHGTAKLKIDPVYLTTMLKSLDKETTLSIDLHGDDPIKITTGDHYTYVVMPMSGCADAHVTYDESAEPKPTLPDPIPEAVTGTDDSGNVPPHDEPVKKTKKKTKKPHADLPPSASTPHSMQDEPVPIHGDSALQERVLKLMIENDHLHAKIEHYKTLLSRAMKVIRKNNVRVV